MLAALSELPEKKIEDSMSVVSFGSEVSIAHGDLHGLVMCRRTSRLDYLIHVCEQCVDQVAYWFQVGI